MANPLSEPLESRVLLHSDLARLSSTGTLIINTTAFSESYVVQVVSGMVQVQHDGLTEDFDPAGVLRVYADGGEGNDNISVILNVRTTLIGGNGDDILSGGNRQDSITGDSGRDVLTGNIGNDTLIGGGGGDKLYGKGGSDSLDGGAGTDLLNGGLAGDFMNGGRDNDRIFSDGSGDNVFGGSGTDTLVVGAGEPMSDGVEVIQ